MLTIRYWYTTTQVLAHEVPSVALVTNIHHLCNVCNHSFVAIEQYSKSHSRTPPDAGVAWSKIFQCTSISHDIILSKNRFHLKLAEDLQFLYRLSFFRLDILENNLLNTNIHPQAHHQHPKCHSQSREIYSTTWRSSQRFLHLVTNVGKSLSANIGFKSLDLYELFNLLRPFFWHYKRF